MNTEQFTSSSQELINKSISIALSNNNPSLVPLHTLAAGLEDEFCVNFFRVLGVPVDQLKQIVQQELAKLPQIQGAQLVADYSMEQFLKELKKEADALHDTYISLEHFLLGWADTNLLP